MLEPCRPEAGPHHFLLLEVLEGFGNQESRDIPPEEPQDTASSWGMVTGLWQGRAAGQEHFPCAFSLKGMELPPSPPPPPKKKRPQSLGSTFPQLWEEVCVLKCHSHLSGRC